MRPPILQWKIALALLAVVLVGVVLGSALRPTNLDEVAVANYVPRGPDTVSINRYYKIMEMTPKKLRAFCQRLKPAMATGKWIVNGYPTPSLCSRSKHH